MLLHAHHLPSGVFCDASCAWVYICNLLHIIFPVVYSQKSFHKCMYIYITRNVIKITICTLICTRKKCCTRNLLNISTIGTRKTQSRSTYIIIYVYIYNIIRRICFYSVLMLSILIIFRVQHFFRVRIWANTGQYSYFYYISGTQIPTPESAFKWKLKKKGGGVGMPRGLKKV